MTCGFAMSPQDRGIQKIQDGGDMWRVHLIFHAYRKWNCSRSFIIIMCTKEEGEEAIKNLRLEVKKLPLWYGTQVTWSMFTCTSGESIGFAFCKSEWKRSFSRWNFRCSIRAYDVMKQEQTMTMFSSWHFLTLAFRLWWHILECAESSFVHVGHQCMTQFIDSM